MADRYFLATALGGRLYWEDTGLTPQDETVVDLFANPRFAFTCTWYLFQPIRITRS